MMSHCGDSFAAEISCPLRRRRTIAIVISDGKPV